MRIAKKADRPIHCYKLLFFNNGRNLFTSPVTKTEYWRGKVLYETRFPETLPEIQGTPWANVTYGFHSYMSIDRICVYGQMFALDDPGALDMLYALAGVVVARCVIPYGAKYWEGNGGGRGSDEYDQYCSDRIELVAYLDPETGKWKRPGRAYDEAAEPTVSILRGLTITEARERLGRWYVLESQRVNYNSGVYRFNRVGTYGSLELRTWCNRVISVN
jgi:hypothetical protein